MPSLIEADTRLSVQQIIDTIHNGKGRMPAFPGIQNERLMRLVHYVQTGVEIPSGATIGTSPIPDNQLPMEVAGARVYQKHCAVCHGEDCSGNELLSPRLTSIGLHLSSRQLTSTIRNGKGRMPSFSVISITDGQMNAPCCCISAPMRRQISIWQ